MLTPFGFVVVGLAGFRLTRLVVFDSLFGFNLESGSAMARRLDVWAWQSDGNARPGRTGWVKDKIGNLLVCAYCTGFWLTLGCWALMVYGNHPTRMAVTAVAATGLAALLNNTDHRIGR